MATFALSGLPVLTLILVELVTIITALDSYDFIIVGGGTAGCALAKRLTDDGQYTVLLLESGHLPKQEVEVPINVPATEATFSYHSLPQRFASLQNAGIVEILSGKILGGSSWLAGFLNSNGMWFNRGNSRDWNWIKVTRDPTWNYDNMLQYFKRSERYEGNFPSDQHGYLGPITVSSPKYSAGLDYWLSAGAEMGYPIADPNGPQKPSFAPVEFSNRFGRPQNSFWAYLQPVLFSRPKNIHVIMNTNVTQIIFEGFNAIGVRLRTTSPDKHNITERVVYANKEVIVSSGVIGSAVLLQRSGIGPKSLLEAAGIPLVQDLPVGANFQDHVYIPIHVAVNNDSVVLNNDKKDLATKNSQVLTMHGHGSPYSGTGQAFVVSNTALLEGEGEWPDLHFSMPQKVHAYSSVNLTANSSKPTTGVGFNLRPHEALMSMAVILTRPKSRGSVYLNPNDINGMPLLDVGYFSVPSDMQRLLEGIKEAIRIFEQTSTYKKIGARILAADFPACQNRVLKSDQYWKCYIRQVSQTGMNAGGTCRMGSGINDPEAVVDSTLRVIGVAGLRVVDASIMPVLTNANIQAAVYGIAEKAADMILNYWNLGII